MLSRCLAANSDIRLLRNAGEPRRGVVILRRFFFCWVCASSVVLCVFALESQVGHVETVLIAWSQHEGLVGEYHLERSGW